MKNKIEAIRKEKGIKQAVLLRITPGIDPHTYEEVATGKVDSKFGSAIATGQALEIVEAAISAKNIDLVGLHCHIGSQIFDIEPFSDAADIMVRFIDEIKESLALRYVSLISAAVLALPTPRTMLK